MANTKMTLPITKLFDLHMEIGSVLGGKYYAKIILGKNQVLFYREGPSPAVAIAELASDMENTNMWQAIFNNPSISVYPFQTASGKPPVPALKTKIDPNAPKQLPGRLTAVVHPDCQPQCTSFDLFGASKCKSMCGHRSGI